jgi:hypothetical protein
MEKFEKVVSVNDEIGNVINDLIFSSMETDYNDYELGDRVTYEFWLDDDFEDYNDDCNINEIKEFVGEGVCLEDKELSDIWGKDIWYNVSIRKSISSYFEGESLFVEFLADESMCEKI